MGYLAEICDCHQRLTSGLQRAVVDSRDECVGRFTVVGPGRAKVRGQVTWSYECHGREAPEAVIREAVLLCWVLGSPWPGACDQ